MLESINLERIITIVRNTCAIVRNYY